MARQPLPLRVRLRQGVAGLATYAYRELGWRRAAVVLGDWDPGWGGRDAFDGGVLRARRARAAGSRPGRVLRPGGPRPRARAARRRRRGGASARRSSGPPASCGSSGGAAGIPRAGSSSGRAHRRPVRCVARRAAARSTACTGSSSVDPEQQRAYLRAFAAAFPGIPPDVAAADQVSGYRDAVEARLRGARARGGGSRAPAGRARAAATSSSSAGESGSTATGRRSSRRRSSGSPVRRAPGHEPLRRHRRSRPVDRRAPGAVGVAERPAGDVPPGRAPAAVGRLISRRRRDRPREARVARRARRARRAAARAGPATSARLHSSRARSAPVRGLRGASAP